MNIAHPILKEGASHVCPSFLPLGSYFDLHVLACYLVVGHLVRFHFNCEVRLRNLIDVFSYIFAF